MNCKMDLSKYYQNLSSERLILRKLTTQDINSWQAFYINNPNLKYLGIDLNRSIEVMSKAWIDAQLERYSNNQFGQLAIILKSTNDLLGTIGFIIDERCEKGEIIKATAIKPQYWGQGIATEASIILCNAVFENDWAEKIIGFRHQENFLSQKLSRRLNFTDIATIKELNRKVTKYQLTKQTWEQYYKLK